MEKVTYQDLLKTIIELQERAEEFLQLVNKISDLECFKDTLSPKTEEIAARVEPMLKRMSDEIDSMNSSLSCL